MKTMLRLSLLICILASACSLPQAQASPTAIPMPESTSTPLNSAAQPAGYITFVINVHDWVYVNDSADILIQLVNLFEKYGVRGDFYFTAPVVEQYVQQRPDLIERLKNSNMTISYHVRPPHPLYTGFDERLKGLDDETLYQTLRDYETYALDLSNGDLDRSRPGGYSYVAQVFGRNPVVVPAPNSDPRIKAAALRVYTEMGAKMTILYHEEGTKIDTPFEYIEGLLVRPSDFSITRVTSINGSDNFWWNYMSAPDAEKYNPTSLLKSLLAEWQTHHYDRPPIITALIHENNYYRSGAEAWSSYYFKMEKGQKTDPLDPPYDLNARDYSKERSPEEQRAILDAYEELVAYAVANLEVVTSEDLLEIAAGW